MSVYLFRIAALSLAIVAGLAVPPLTDRLTESAGAEVETTAALS